MSYATIQDLLARKDRRTLGDLVSDTGTQVTGEDLDFDDKLQAALDDASGDIEAALLAGAKFTPEQLAALAGHSAAHLARICCEIAMFHLLNRRPSAHPEQWEFYQKSREALLEPLRQGVNVFNIAENIAAGVASSRVPSVADFEKQGLWRDRMPGLYPARPIRRN